MDTVPAEASVATRVKPVLAAEQSGLKSYPASFKKLTTGMLNPICIGSAPLPNAIVYACSSFDVDTSHKETVPSLRMQDGASALYVIQGRFPSRAAT